MTEAERRSALERVAEEVRICTRCRLHESRTQAVPGEGHPSTEVLFVGEGPGLNEDRQGRPFVGAAGQFLTELLGSVGWRRDDVFITNVVKCRPPANRDPEPDEIEACAPFLRRQLDALDPALVVTLGRHSMGRFLPGARIGQVHGTYRPGPAELGAGDALVFAMYHPAAALHQGSLRQTLLDDMAQVPAALLEARQRRASGAEQGAAPTVEQGAVPANAEPGAVPANAEPGAATAHAEQGAAPAHAEPEPAPEPLGSDLAPAGPPPRLPEPPERPEPPEPSEPLEPTLVGVVAAMSPAVDAAADRDDQMTLF